MILFFCPMFFFIVISGLFKALSHRIKFCSNDAKESYFNSHNSTLITAIL